MMASKDKLNSLVNILNEAKSGKVEIYPTDLNLFEELIADLEQRLKLEDEVVNDDLWCVYLSTDEVRSVHSLMMTRPLGYLDDVRKQIENAYDSINARETVGEY